MVSETGNGSAPAAPCSGSHTDEAHTMAYLIENWLDKSFVRRMFSFCTARDKCGRRIEIALEIYAGKKVRACSRCHIAAKMVGKIFDRFVDNSDIKREDIALYLQDSMWRKGLASVLEGVVEWGPQKPFTAFAPFLIVWNITRSCNLRCKHCYALAGTKDPNELNDEESIAAVDAMAKAGVAYIALSGGEPLIRPNVFDIIDRIRSHGMAFSIATNATLLTKEKAAMLKERNCLFVQVSLDGADAETHNAFRGRNAFELTLQGIRNAVEAGLHVGIASTVTQHNYDQVGDIIDLAERIGAKTFMHYNFIPTGRGKDIINTDLSPEQREKMLHMFAEETKKRKISVLSTACQYSRVCMETDAAVLSMTHFDNSQIPKSSPLSVLASFVGGCGTGRLYAALDYDGSITPCVFIPIKLGNIRHDNLLDVWLNADVFKKIRARKDFKGLCQTCGYREVCGGCRARAYGYYGDIQQSDPGCILNVGEWNRLKSQVVTSRFNK